MDLAGRWELIHSGMKGRGGAREGVLRQCLGAKSHAQPKGALHFHSHVPGGTGAFPLLQKDQCAYPSSL